MDPTSSDRDRWRQLERLFEAAVECSPSERAALLESRCADDPDLRREVEELLEADAQTGGMLDEPVHVRRELAERALEDAAAREPSSTRQGAHSWDHASLESVGRGPARDPSESLAATRRLGSTEPEGEHPDSETSSRDASRIGRFAILERIGAGGMGEVFAAYDEKLDRKIALKVVHSSRALSRTDQARLEREARALARLSHPNVVTVFDTGLHGGQLFIAMEFVRGVTLRQWQQDRAWTEIIEVFVAAGRGLGAMHELGLVHRDFKPANVLVDDKGRPRLIDFGLVGVERDRAPTATTEPGAESSTRLTMTGSIMGTPRYMSPEQFEGLPASAASDQFSFCVALFEAIHGVSPFEGESMRARAMAVRTGTIASPPLPEGVPSQLRDIIVRGLEREPWLRWPSMQSLLDALQALLIEHDRQGDDPSSRRLSLRVVLLLLGIGAVGNGAIMATKGSLDPSADLLLISDAVLLGVFSVAIAASRSRWMPHRRTRRLIAFLLLVLTLCTVQDLIGYLSGRPTYSSIVSDLASVCVLCSFAALVEGKTMVRCGVWVALWLVFTLIDPARYTVYYSAANTGLAVILGWSFRGAKFR